MIKLTHILENILFEYSQAQIDKTIKRWENEPNFDKNVALNLIKTFDNKKSGLSSKLDLVVLPDKLKQGNNYLNIDLYSYEDMKRLINSIPENPETVKKTAINRFVELFGINKQTAQSYVARFLYNKDKLKLAAKEGLEDIGVTKEEVLNLIPKKLQRNEAFLDPRNWNWISFEQITDALFPSQKTSEDNINLATAEGDKVYDKDGIEIYKGDDIQKCISYNPVIEKTKKKKYGWCVTQVGNTNYDFYRFKNQAPTFYFVFDRNKPSSPEHALFDDEWHAFVIQVTADKKTYIVTGANNRRDIDTGDKGWEGIANIVPPDTWNKIKNLKDYFVPVPLSAVERARKYASGMDLSLDEFKELSQDEKILYIQGKASKNQISTDILKILPKYKISYQGKTTTLANIAIDSGQEIPYSVLKDNEALAKRYAIFRFRHTNYGNLPIPLPFVKYLDEPAKEKYLKTFDNNLTFEYIEKYFGEKSAQKYVNEQIKTLNYLPPGAIKYITDPKIKDLYLSYSKLFKNWQNSANTNIDEERLENSKQMPIQEIDPVPIMYDDWKEFSNKEKQIIYNLAKTADNNTEEYLTVSYAVPFFLQDGEQKYALLPEDDTYENWVITDMNGNIISEFKSIESISLKNKPVYGGYPDYSNIENAKRIYKLSDLQINGKPVSLKEIKRILKLAGILR